MLPRIYIPQPFEPGQTIALSKEASHHLVTVLRLKVGHPVFIFNGEAGDYHGEIVSTGKVAHILIKQFEPKEVESQLVIHLGQGISRGDRMDFTVQKATELGVQFITPLVTAKCMIKLKEDRIERKVNHWESIVMSAAEQSGRTIPPTLFPPQDLATWLAEPFEGLSLVLDPEATQSMKSICSSAQKIRILIGPEAGLAEQEVKLAVHQGFQSVRLGPRILRTETASMATIAALQYQFGDL